MTQEFKPGVLNGWDVLVVDDEPDSLEVARLLLIAYGATVIEARNGEEGIAKAREHKPRFIISDLSMPKMDGWDMVDELQRDRATATIPVIALTAHAMEGDRVKAIGAGFHNYLTKPLVPETFVQDVLNLLLDLPEIATQLEAS